MEQPTNLKPKTKMGDEVQGKINGSLNDLNVKLEEERKKRGEKRKSLKRKIFSLDKMEALVHSDPKLSLIYSEMAEDGREKYGYHYNETIMNIIFNDYILNSPKYLQKYKNVKPVKKKRRDQSGIDQLRKRFKDDEERIKSIKKKKTDMDETEDLTTFSRYGKGSGNIDYNFGELNETVKTDSIKPSKTNFKSGEATGQGFKGDSIADKPDEVEESTTTGGAGDYQYAGPGVWSKTGKPAMRRPFWVGGKVIGEGDYLTESKSFKIYNEMLNELILVDQALDVLYENEKNKILTPFEEKKLNDALNMFEKIVKNEAPSKDDIENFYDNYLPLIDTVVGRMLNKDHEYALKEKNMENMSNKISEHHKKDKQSQINFILKNVNNVKDLKGVLSELPNDVVEKMYNELERKMGLIDETETSLIDQNPTTMANKPQPIGDLGNEVEMGARSMNEHHLTTKNDQIAFICKAYSTLYYPNENIDMSNLANQLEKFDEEKVQKIYLDSEKKLREKGIDPKTVKIDEKAESKAQQRYMGTVRGVQKGGVDPDGVSKEIKQTAKEMDPEDVKDFASTKHDNLPEKVDEVNVEGETSWVGTDADIETSLFEYGVVAKQPENRDYPDEWFVLFNVGGTNKFDTGWIRETEIDAIVEGKEWADSSDIERFLSYVGQSEEEWKKLPFVSKLSDLISYWGQENILGSSYHPISKEEAENLLYDNSDKEEDYREMVKEIEDDDVDALFNQTDELLNEIGYYKKKMNEEKKTSSMVSKERIGKENQKNFKSDLELSGTKEAIEAQKDLQHKDQQTEITDPKKFSEDIEKESLKKTDGSLENVGDSTADGKNIPKRNITDEEQETVDRLRKGQEDWQYDNTPSEKFEERMKDGMGEEMYEKRKKKMKMEKDKPMYNKDSQPVFDADEKEQYNKFDISESDAIVTGLYFDDVNRRKLIDFQLNEAKLIEQPTDDLFKLHFDGLGNTYTSNVKLNENLVNALNNNEFYIDKKGQIFVTEKPNVINEEKNVLKNVLDESIVNKMKHLYGYNPKDFTETKNVKTNRGF